MTIEFNSAKMAIDFEKHLIGYLIMLQKEVLEQAQTAPGQTPEGASDLTIEAVQVLGTVILGRVIGGPWATMSEWGTGSLMDTSNPHLSKYRQSDRWNPARHDTKIRSRPRGTYTDIFGNQKTSRAARAGVDLEWLESQGRLKNFELYLIPPCHGLQVAMRWMQQGRFWQVVQQAINTFPFHRYLIVRNTR